LTRPGAPVEVDISTIKPGEKLTVEWRGKPVWVVRRTPEQLAELPKVDKLLADPKTSKTTRVRVFKSSGVEIKA